MTDRAPPLLSMLQRLPPSKELLDFYHKKLEQYVEDEQRWLKRLASTKKAVDQTETLEKDLFAQKREITALQKAVTDMREALVQERLLHQTWYDENFDNLIPEEITWKQIDLPARIDVFERKRRQKLCTNSVSNLWKMHSVQIEAFFCHSDFM